MRNLVLGMLLLTAGTALAQPAPPMVVAEPETVYSDAQRAQDEQLSRRFVQSLLQPSHNLEGQFSRWKIPLCPHVVGLSPDAAYVVERRIRDIARQVGAPLDQSDPCTPNIVVFVTPHPQALLDAIAKKEFLLLASTSHRDRLTVNYPVQAWYYGYYRDANGQAWLDMDWEFYLDGPPSVAATDTRLRNGIQPGMGVATILVDSAAITGLTLGSLGDYLALMSLSQTPATGRCQPAPSISNLFLTGCEADFHTASLSEADLAMLTALYQTPDEPEKVQMIRLITNMRRNLQGDARK